MDTMAESLLTEEEICTLLRVSREATLKFRRDPVDPIPHMKAGRRYLYEKTKVLKWAERNAKRDNNKRRRL